MAGCTRFKTISPTGEGLKGIFFPFRYLIHSKTPSKFPSAASSNLHSMIKNYRVKLDDAIIFLVLHAITKARKATTLRLLARMIIANHNKASKILFHHGENYYN